MADVNAPKIYPLTIEPGIQRDGTKFAKKNWIDGQWTRFYRGLPQKILGYQEIPTDNPNIPRGIYVLPVTPNFNVYIGDQASLNYIPIDFEGGVVGSIVNRTPAFFNANPNNDWQFDVMYSVISNTSKIIAFAAPNLTAIDASVASPIYYGDVLATTPLVPTGISVTGGIVVLHPYLFMYGDSGLIQWSNINDPTTINNTARVAPYKIVAGLATRGGNTSPAGLFWSLDRLIRATFIQTNSGPTFQFDTITAESSILSSNSIIEYDSIYYWAGVDRFLTYNGVVQELPNNMSLNFFFNNVNYDQRQKVWASKIPNKGEIWWFFPTGNNTECNAAVIYNVREDCWYDTLIDRGCGYYDQTFSQPIWGGNAPVLVRELNSPYSTGAYATSGTAANAFLPDLTTPNLSCTQNASDGTIGYEWPTEFLIQTVTIISNTTQNYTLNLQSWNGADAPVTVLAIPEQTYTARTPYTFTITSPVANTHFQIVEHGGETLDIFRLVFNTNNVPIWRHEQGLDQETADGTVTAIDTFIESSVISLVAADANRQYQEVDRWTYLYRFEPDFVQSGEMTLTVKGSNYARTTASPSQNELIVSNPYTFLPNDVKIDMREQRREMTLRFESNTIGGYFEMGQCLMVIKIGDGRQ